VRKNNKRMAVAIVCVLLAASLIAGVLWKFNPEGEAQAGDEISSQPASDQAAAGEDAAALQASPLSKTYKKAAENERFILYLKEENLAIRVKDKSSGYVWSSVIEDENAKDNVDWKNFMGSGLSIEYFQKDMAKVSRTDLWSEENKTIAVTQAADGFSAKIGFTDLKISLELHVKLEGNQLVVNIPSESIQESNAFTLASVYVYPFLGATRGGEVPGYMFIPDGPGALISLKDNEGKFKQPYEVKIYGANEGNEFVTRDKRTNPPNAAQYPIFGIVHGEKKNGMFAVVENGQFNAKILAYPNGVNTQYNWITAQFISRESYIQPTSRTMGGIVAHEKSRNNENIQTRYFFLSGKDADYVAMAKLYRSYLQNKGVLVRQTGSTLDIPIQLDFLGAESKKGLFRKRIVSMTTVAQLKAIMADVKNIGILNPVVVYRGWNKGGFSGTNPSGVKFESRLGSADDFSKLIADLKKDSTPLYFYDDYTTAYETGRFSPRSDAAKKVDKTVLQVPTFKDVYDSYYYISADKSASLVKENIKKYADKQITGIAVGNTGNLLFSEWHKGKVQSRANTAVTYKDMMEQLGKSGKSVLLYSPNDYMLKYADQVLKMPMESSRYIYESETVPFMEIVLKGYKDYFAPYANFFANPGKELLQMVEYGAYPSYYLTHEASIQLKFTNSDDIYTSAYKDWKENISATYQTLNDALKPVRDATIEDRIQPIPGVVEMVYSNGKAVIVNYTEADYNASGVSVPAKGFKVIEVER
jgi:hypothetical protein